MNRTLETTARIVLVALAYFASARLGYAFSIPNAFVSLWPPAGVTLAFLLMSDRRDWPALFAGAVTGSVASDLMSGYPPVFALFAAVANAAESLLAAWVVTWRLGGPVRRLTVRAVVEIALTAAVGTNAVTSIVGATMLALRFNGTFINHWLTWWVGDGLGMVIIAPLVIAWVDALERRSRPRVSRVIEAALLLTGMALMAHAVFGPPRDWFIRPGVYATFPFLLWAGLRFGSAAASSAAFVLASYSIWNAALGRGPLVALAGQAVAVTAAQVYAFLVVASLCALLPAVALEERRAEEKRRRAIEEKNREREEHHRIVVEAATDAIITLDEQSVIDFVNPAAERAFGYTRDELVGRNLTSLMPERFRDRHRAGIGRYLATNQRTIEWRGVPLIGLHKDGREIPFEVSFGDRVEGGRHVLTGVLRDVSEREAAASALRAFEEQFRQSQKMEAVGQLAGGVAHDFNNLLTAILGYTAIIADQVPPDSAIQEDLEEVRLAAQRAEALTRQLLAFSRRQILEPRVIDLERVLSSLTPMLRRLIGEDIEVVAHIAPDLGRVLADPSQIEQVILNLSLNARDAMPEGGTLTLELQDVGVGLEGHPGHADVAPGAYVMLAVSDTGIGMDAKTAEHAFEPFFTTKPSGKGTGLGLATVHGIVKQSGGYVWLSSEPGRGTTFKVFLPRVERTDEAPARAKPAAAARGTETILLTEDDAPLRRLAQRVLEQQGYTVLPAATPTEALAIANAGGAAIDLLVTDVVMPEMNGRALAELIVASDPEIRVLYMSGYTDDAVVRRGVLQHGMHFIQKPFDPDLFAHRVRETLDVR